MIAAEGPPHMWSHPEKEEPRWRCPVLLFRTMHDSLAGDKECHEETNVKVILQRQTEKFSLAIIISISLKCPFFFFFFPTYLQEADP